MEDQISHVKRDLGRPVKFATYRAFKPREPVPFADRVRALSWQIWVALIFTALVPVDFWALGHLTRHISLPVNLQIQMGFWLWMWMWAVSTKAPKAVIRMMDIPSVVPQFAVVVRPSCGIKRLAPDTGVVHFSDGFLHFEGQRLTFSLETGSLNGFDDIRKLKSFGRPYGINWRHGSTRGRLAIYV